MATTCAACNEPLVMEVSPDSDSEDNRPGPSSTAQQTVPDDLHLPCNCHYHWQCALDLSPQISTSLSCPSCSRSLLNSSSAQPQISATYHSEGGCETLDLYPIIQEEALLSSQPETRPARALHTMASENDVEGIVELLRDTEPEDRAALLGYRDPLAGGRNALHVAAETGKMDAFWLLLWVGSELGGDNFSAEMRRTMEAIRLERVGGIDLRFLGDDEGRTVGDLAARLGGEWEGLINGGLFLR